MAEGLVVIRGGGDIGSGVALRLWRIGYNVVILERAAPIAVRRTVAFSEAVYDGSATVEEATAWLTDDPLAAVNQAAEPGIWMVVDPDAATVPSLRPIALVDAILAKRNTGTTISMASIVVGLGPGFTAAVDVHCVVETNRGPHLGRVIWQGTAEPNTGEPGVVGGRGKSRVLRAPRAGMLDGVRAIGDIVEEGQVVARVDGCEVRAGFRGVVRGLARDGLYVQEAMKIGDIDARMDPTLCRLVSDKALAIAGGVVEAVLTGTGNGVK